MSTWIPDAWKAENAKLRKEVDGQGNVCNMFFYLAACLADVSWAVCPATERL